MRVLGGIGNDSSKTVLDTLRRSKPERLNKELQLLSQLLKHLQP